MRSVLPVYKLPSYDVCFNKTMYREEQYLWNVKILEYRIGKKSAALRRIAEHTSGTGATFSVQNVRNKIDTLNWVNEVWGSDTGRIQTTLIVPMFPFFHAQSSDYVA